MDIMKIAFTMLSILLRGAEKRIYEMAKRLAKKHEAHRLGLGGLNIGKEG